ncbi:proteinral secretion pathway protein M [Pseudomonas syringae pv. solidagae]|uniref:Proteinral secretion pathway protein M n=1 Tax=Pseudomonas syringae pv. solidagae TaxID=264458 RepID=A0A3M5KW07_PSESX|nr:proteinral secretion pathway protein M [Pseudomonas syringae pv. solidagae]
MRRPLTSRERRGAALMILALVLCLAYWLLIDSWFAGPLRDINEQTDQLREQQQRYAGLLQQGDSLREQLEQARRDPASSTSLLPGEDPSAVAADLMQRIADLISSQASTGGGCELTQRTHADHPGAGQCRAIPAGQGQPDPELRHRTIDCDPACAGVSASVSVH